ncbi:MAG: tail fiber domain-containing protein, partial [Flavobacterium sp.]
AGFVTSIVAKNPSTNAASAVKIGFDGGGTIWGEIGASYNSNNPYLGFYVRANSEKMRLTDGGNLGLGVTPSAWSLGKAIEVGTLGNSFWGVGINSVQLTSNYFYDGSYKYANSGFANRYDIGSSSGIHAWYNAPSSTAGGAISFTQAMTLTNGGNLLVGTTTDSGYKLDVNGTGNIKNQLTIGNGTTASNSSIKLLGVYAVSYEWNITNDANGLSFISTSPVTALKLNASTGAATFSSSVTATSGIIQNATGNNSTLTVYRGTSQTYGARITALDVDGSVNFESIGDATGPNIYFKLRTLGTPVTAMTITSAGNVGIGTTSPSQKLEVSGGAIIASGFANRAAGTGKALEIGMDGTQGLLQAIDRTASALIPLYFSSSAATFSSTLTTGGTITASGGLYLKQDSTTANQITISGLTDVNKQLIIGYYTTGNGYSVIQSVYQGVGYTPIVLQQNGGNILLGTTTDNGERLYVSGTIRATGTITANSDIRLKKNLERIENALEKVGQISGYTYNTIYDEKRHGGVIAQEIDEVFPEIVNKGNDGLLGVEYGNISALLIEALKELKDKNTALEARLQALEK